MIESHLRSLRLSVPALICSIAAALSGAFVPAYTEAMGEGIAKLCVLPVLLLLAFSLAHSRKLLLVIIMTLRASGDVALEYSKFSIGGARIGIGGLINAFVIVIAILLVFERPVRVPRRIWWTWVPFLIVATIGVALSPDRGAAFRLLLQLLSSFAVFVSAFCLVDNHADFRRCVKVLLLSAAIPASYGLLQIATGDWFASEDAGNRIQSTFSHPNILAFYLTLVISLTLYLIKSATERRLSSAGLTAYFLLLLALLVFTKTRSAWITSFLMFLLYGLFFERRYLVYLLVAVAASFLIPEVSQRALEVVSSDTVVSSYTPLNSFQWRVSIWRSAFDWMSPEYYAFGYGLEAFPALSTVFFREAGNVQWGAHNDYVQLFFELGIFGVAAYLWMYGYLLQQIRSLFSIDKLAAFTLTAIVVGYLVAAASDNLLQYLSFNWYLWFICGAGLALVPERDRQASTAEGVLKPGNEPKMSVPNTTQPAR